MLCMKFYTLETTNVLTGANAVVMFGKRPGFWHSYVLSIIYNFCYHNMQFYPLKPKDDFALIEHLAYIHIENALLKVFENHLIEFNLPSLGFLLRVVFSTFRLFSFLISLAYH